MEDLGDGFNGSNFDTQSVQGFSMNQYAAGTVKASVVGDNYGVPSRVFSMNEKRLTQMQQYQMIKGMKSSGLLNDVSAVGDHLNRPMSHG